jgi:predicted nucleotidyltransferase
MNADFSIDNTQVRELLNILIPQIIEEVSPKKIILFGSAARKEVNKYNDIDLLIIVNDGQHRRQTAQHLYQNVKSGVIPVDYVVATETDIDLYRSVRGYIYFKALKEGILLYEEQNH